MSERVGTVVEFDRVDGLGWIDLEDGTRVRFGASALKGFDTVPAIGTRVRVRGTAPGFRGVLKAVEIVPLEDPDPEAGEDEVEDADDGDADDARDGQSWRAIVRTRRRFSDVADTCLEPPAALAEKVPPLALPEHPVFAPWHAEICAAPIRVGLRVPTFRDNAAFDPSPEDSFAHGRIAWVERQGWPTCGRCRRPFEMCLQVSPQDLAPWVADRGALVLMFCFHCGVAERTDPQVAYVRFAQPRVRVMHPDLEWESASSGWLSSSQRVVPQPPQRLPPESLWLRYRSEITPSTAASALFGFDDLELVDLPPGVDPDDVDDLGAEFDDWIEDHLPAIPYPGAYLGGFAEWDQADETPSCAEHGPMRHLLDYAGGQFLDGALHVFVCPTCHRLGHVAEF